jgi:hypothetical protein
MTTLENNSPQAPSSPRYLLVRHGQAFSTRARGEEIRAEIEQMAAASSEVLIDFAGVRSVSYSFADEAIGVIVSEHLAQSSRPRPVVIGLTAQAQRVLLGSLAQRGVSEEISRQLVPH